MPLLDIATPQPSFRNSLYSLGFQRLHHHASAHQRSTYIRINPTSLELSRRRSHFVIKAVATLEPRCSGKEDATAQHIAIDSPTSLNESSSIQDEKEMLRRKRISKANKGKEAWNKGRQHSPETRQKIRERTKIAMHSPKVKMKLRKVTHSQSHETRKKIGAAVRLTWDRRRLKRRMIARCHLEWLNLIAEASRKGLSGQEELQWDSYKTISEQLEKEFREGIAARKERKPTPATRAPKTAEQRKKISEAIAAKWADPAYRDRVYCGMAKRRGTTRSPETRDPTWGTRKKEASKTKPTKKREHLYGTRARSPRPKYKTSSSRIQKEAAGRYKDPQARFKLEMIKSIRAQRAGSDPKISEAITRANVLIREAERAAEALEAAAAENPMAEASLVETRKLIAEAMSYMKSIEMVHAPPPPPSPESGSEKSEIGVNGIGGVGVEIGKLGEFRKLVGVEDEDEDEVVNGMEHIDLSSSSSLFGDLELQRKKAEERGGKGRRWVCGRLVEDED